MIEKAMLLKQLWDSSKKVLDSKISVHPYKRRGSGKSNPQSNDRNKSDRAK